jgi:xanthine/CO dehydrogenase XdhC/CoxF family maturation factor
LAVVRSGEFPHASRAVSELKAIVEKFGAARGPLALATAVRTTGSTYRRPGARLLLDGSGRLAGSLSSGCLEDSSRLPVHHLVHDGRVRHGPWMRHHSHDAGLVTCVHHLAVQRGGEGGQTTLGRGIAAQETKR